jgi:hypothetical protein
MAQDRPEEFDRLYQPERAEGRINCVDFVNPAK